jgi:glycosyltransferase involved in cell wall biosynthesis
MSDGKIRIAHVIATLGHGGSEHRLLDYLSAANKKRFDQYVCCVSRGGPLESQIREHTSDLYIARRRFRFDLSVIWQLKQFFEKNNIHIVHTRNFTANLWGRLAARLAGAKVVLTTELGTAWTETALMRRCDHFLSRMGTLCVANSIAAREVLALTGICGRGKIKVMRDGFFPAPPAAHGSAGSDLREGTGIGPDTKLVGVVGRLVGTKGVNYALEALSGVLKEVPSCVLVVRGDGPQRELLEQKASVLGIRNSVRFIGYRDDYTAFVQSLDLVLSCSIHDCLPGNLVEAGLLGVPVVAPRVDGIPEIVADGVTGVLCKNTEKLDDQFVDETIPRFVYDPDSESLVVPSAPNPSVVSSAVCDLLTDSRKAKAMGIAAAEKLGSTYLAQFAAPRLESLYEELYG